MAEPLFQLIFAGQLLAGTPREQARRAIQECFKLSAAQLDRLFSGEPIRVKRDLSRSQAERYQRAFRAAGAVVELRPMRMDPEPPTAAHAAPAPTDDDPLKAEPLEVSPTLPLESATVDQSEPTVDDLTLLPPGTPIGERRNLPARPPPDIDHLELAPTEATSLEDCAPPMPKPPPLDLSDLALAPLDDETAETKHSSEQNVS